MTATPARSRGVTVPASSANLGPGFDALAVALDLPLTVDVVAREQRRVIAEGLGSDELPSDDGNLIWRALLAYCARFGAAVPDVSLRTRNAIPLERGLGSSAAAAVAGAALGRAVTGAGGSDADVIAVAAELEGHADNAAAAMLGGLVVIADGVARRLQPSQRLRPVVCMPAARQSTAAARGVLPAAVPLADAAANGARTAVVLAGLSGAIGWDAAAMVDVLHEPARLRVMTDSGRLVAALRGAGVAACLSGAGPSVLAVVPAGDERAVATVRDHADAGWQVWPGRWDLAGATEPSGKGHATGARV